MQFGAFRPPATDPARSFRLLRVNSLLGRRGGLGSLLVSQHLQAQRTQSDIAF
jgi:hypothetical protein